MHGPRSKPPGVLRRTDVSVTARVPCLDVEDEAPRALALAPDPAVAEWIAEELRHTEVELTVVASVDEAIDALFGSPRSRAQLLIADLDPLDAAATLQLHAVRARGWFGAIIALGAVSPDLRLSLAITRTLARPLDDGSLERAVDALGLCNPTIPVSIVTRPNLR